MTNGQLNCIFLSKSPPASGLACWRRRRRQRGESRRWAESRRRRRSWPPQPQAGSTTADDHLRGRQSAGSSLPRVVGAAAGPLCPGDGGSVAPGGVGERRTQRHSEEFIRPRALFLLLVCVAVRLDLVAPLVFGHADRRLGRTCCSGRRGAHRWFGCENDGSRLEGWDVGSSCSGPDAGRPSGRGPAGHALRGCPPRVCFLRLLRHEG